MVRISVLNDTLKVRFRENRDATSVARAFARAISERTSSSRGPLFCCSPFFFLCVSSLLLFCVEASTDTFLSVYVCVCVR